MRTIRNPVQSSADTGPTQPTSPTPLKGKRTAGLPTNIATEVRAQITRGVLSPGVHLGQAELAQKFGASRVPIREALKLLTAEGVVIHDPNRGFFIASLSSDEARQLYRMRHLLEAEILASVQWPNKQQLAEMGEHLDRMEKLLATGKAAEWTVEHRRFHQMVFDLSPLRYIVEEVERLLRLTDRYRSLLQPSLNRTAQQERHLLKALANRDRARLLAGFEEDRAEIEAGILQSLAARGL
jgi:DNA-binding GntR family transcriptional regulator